MADKLNVIAVGDVVTDAFIKLFDDQAHAYANEHGKWLAMQFATKIPFDHVEVLEGVGNASNAAVAFSRLGLKAGFITNVGDDKEGRDMIRALNKQKVDTRFVRINPDKKSNYHYVLWYKEERTILIKHESYDYDWPHLRKAEIPEWLYFSSVSENALEYHDEVADWLDKHPEVKLAWQPGTFQMKVGTERLQRLYARSEATILNREEAVLVTGGDYRDIHDLLNRMHGLGTRIAVITDGPNGAYASDGNQRLKMPLYPDPAPPKERTGAGDAFASTFVAALAKGYNIEGALQWAPINSMSVVQQTGAQAGLLSERKLEEYLRNSPEWYRPTPF